MSISLTRGDIYYCESVRLPASKNRLEEFRDKYVLVLQGGYFFRNTDRVNIILGTSQRTDNLYPTDVLIKPANVIEYVCNIKLHKDTKFNCAEIYLFRKVDILSAKKVCKVKEDKMKEIDIALIKSLCIELG